VKEDFVGLIVRYEWNTCKELQKMGSTVQRSMTLQSLQDSTCLALLQSCKCTFGHLWPFSSSLPSPATTYCRCSGDVNTALGSTLEEA